MNRKAHRDLIDRAKLYLAHNAAESGADVLIAELVSGLEGFQPAGWAEPGEAVSEVHEDLAEFVIDHHSAAGGTVLEVMPVWVSKPQFAVTYYAGDGHDDVWEEVDLFDTQEQANVFNAKINAELAAQQSQG